MANTMTGNGLAVQLGVRHPFTASIVEAFRTTKPGELLTYEQISTAAGAPSFERCRGLMPTVRRALLEEHGIALGNERGAGYRHLAPVDVPALGDKRRKHLYKAARVAVREQTHGYGDPSKLPPNLATARMARVSLYGAIAVASSWRAERAVTEAVEVSNGKIDVGSTLSMLGKK